MAPSKPTMKLSGTPIAKRSTQTTLLFATQKRTASSGKAKRGGKRARTDEDEDVSSFSEEEGKGVEEIEEAEEEGVGSKRRRAGVTGTGHPGPSLKTSEKGKEKEEEKAKDKEKEKEKALPTLRPRDPRWKSVLRYSREQNDYMRPIHGENQNGIHEILRVFDMNYVYGPCIGVSRLERWERAEAMGLKPPVEIRDILMTKQGVEEVGLRECVLYDLEKV